ncbi:hypothetical protein SOHN41_00698 [Shewanella sp. HN-41]|nr:hypothetical protein SOHN41_00698 [Shewanella sp. HN-41]
MEAMLFMAGTKLSNLLGINFACFIFSVFKNYESNDCPYWKKWH